VAITADPGPFYPAAESTQGFDERGFTTPGVEDILKGSDAPGALGASWRMDNPLGSFIAQERVTDHIDPNFPYAERYKALEPKYQPHLDRFHDVHNDAAWDARKRQLDRETEDNKALDALPWYQSIPLRITMGALDPTSAAPGLNIIRNVKGGVSIARTAATGAGWAGASAAVQEAELHDTQQTRTATESAVTIGGSVLLGGLIGAGGAKLFSHAEHAAFSKAIETEISYSPAVMIEGKIYQGGSHVDALDRASKELKISSDDLVDRYGGAQGVHDNLDGFVNADGEFVGRAEAYAKVGPASAGADVTRTDPVSIAKPNAAFSASLKMSENLGGTYRMGTNEIPEIRAEGASLLRFGLHMDGPTTPHAVETAVRLHLAFEARAKETIHEQWKTWRQTLPISERLPFNQPVTRSRFEAAISAAARRSDGGEELTNWLRANNYPVEIQPFIEKAASAGRKDVLDRLFEEAKAVRMLDENTDPKFMESYLTRMWNRPELMARREEWTSRASRVFNGYMKRDFIDAVANFKAKLAEIDGKLAGATDDTLEQLRLKRAELEDSFWNTWDVNHLGRNLDLADPYKADFSDHAREIADKSHNRLIGVKEEAEVRPEFMRIQERGPLKDKTLPLRDVDFEDFLVNDYNQILAYYTRIMGVDIELTRRFGEPSGRDFTKNTALQNMKRGWERAIQGKSPEAVDRLTKAYNAGIDDFQKHIDLMRGMGRDGPYETGFGRIARAANQLNYIRIGGGFTISSLTDPVNVALRIGVMNYMKELTSWARQLEGFKMSQREGRLAVAAEKFVGHQHMQMMDLLNPMARSDQNAMERWLDWATNHASRFNGMRLFADFNKGLGAAHTENKVLDFVTRDVTAAQEKYLKFVNIQPGQAKRIAKRFEEHGETLDGYKVANTEKWTLGLEGDALAAAKHDVQVFRAAIHKDTTTPLSEAGVGDLPLWSNTGTGQLLFQFQKFAISSHQHIMLRGMQDGYTKFAGTVVSLTMMGMFIALAKTFWDNRPELRKRYFENPAFWVGEGLDFAGVIAIPMWASNGIEKLTSQFDDKGRGVNPLKAPFRAFGTGDQESQRLANRNVSSVIAGPTIGFAEDLVTAGTGAARAIAGKNVRKAQKNALQRVFPTSYLGVRQFFNYLLNPPEDKQ
jgi:hypothetical protein